MNHKILHLLGEDGDSQANKQKKKKKKKNKKKTLSVMYQNKVNVDELDDRQNDQTGDTQLMSSLLFDRVSKLRLTD